MIAGVAYRAGSGGPGRSDEGRRSIRRGHVDPYALPVRPIRAAPGAAPVVDLRATVSAGPAGAGADSAWERAVDYLRVVAGVPPTTPPATIKPFDVRRGADHDQLAAVLAALDRGAPVAFYGWWPTEEAAATTAILGIDAMEVPPPDRRGGDLVDGHAVVILGYGRHDSFPGGGYVIVRSGWGASGWGDGGDGYMPFTYLRTYATELCTIDAPDDGPGRGLGDVHRPSERQHAGGRSPADRPPAAPPRLPAVPPRTAVDVEIEQQARCADPRASLTHLFFSEDLIELARARAICSLCAVREPCLRRALERQEPWGVWGGELVLDGVVIAEKRGRGRPPKVPRPRLVVDEVTGLPLVPIAV